VSVGSGLDRLDEPDATDELDSVGILAVVENLADQVRDAWDLARSAVELPLGTGIDSILVLGMGGSGVSGDVVRAILESRVAIPVSVLKSYDPIPAWVGRNTLVFAVSYSGGTEETVAAFEQVHGRGSRIVSISSGGRLEELAADLGLAHVAIRPELQPRAALGYLVVPIFAVLEEMGLVPALQDDVNEAVTVLESLRARCERSVPLTDNPSKQLARRLENKIPIVYGGHGLASVAAYRFKCDLNEYAKTPAFWNELPEMNHNEIQGWTALKEQTSQTFAAVFLRDPGEHPRVAKRFDISKRLLRDSVADVVEIGSEGKSSLARLLSLVFITQMAAIYLGLAYGVDPGPVPVLEALKQELARGKEEEE
jgi:glucose/mannose-6-phosphate isomerase